VARPAAQGGGALMYALFLLFGVVFMVLMGLCALAEVARDRWGN
jgi:hypothetical protein